MAGVVRELKEAAYRPQRNDDRLALIVNWFAKLAPTRRIDQKNAERKCDLVGPSQHSQEAVVMLLAGTTVNIPESRAVSGLVLVHRYLPRARVA